MYRLRYGALCIPRFSYSTFAKMLEYKKCFKILGVSEDSDQEQIRTAYLNLVKKYHPDSGTPEADANKFFEIDKAFKFLVKKQAEERWDVNFDDVQEQDIRHTAPQHRQYLSYDGLGIGTPFQREKHYSKIRANKAATNILRHRLSKVAAEENALVEKTILKHKIKTKYGFDRLVEDLIQESMSKGEFNNLRGSGKPLTNDYNKNPYVDFVTHKLNEVLIDNGFTPEWIMLQKEIREDIQRFREKLLSERAILGPFPLKQNDSLIWSNIIQKSKVAVEDINKKIDKFNLVVPILDKQMIQISLKRESEKVLIEGLHSQIAKKIKEDDTPKTAETFNIFDIIDTVFFKK